MQTLCGAVNKAANVILVDMSSGISSKRRKVASFSCTALAKPSLWNSDKNYISFGSQALWRETREAQSICILKDVKE